MSLTTKDMEKAILALPDPSFSEFYLIESKLLPNQTVVKDRNKFYYSPNINYGSEITVINFDAL